MPVEGTTVSSIKTEPYDRLRLQAKKQRRNISDTLDIVLDYYEKNHSGEESE